MSFADKAREARTGTANVLYNIIWPAAAGNVGWSLVTMLVDPRYSQEPDSWPLSDRAPRIAALAVFFVYLCIDWLYSRNPRDGPPASWWENAGNALHIACYTTFSIAATFSHYDLHLLSVPLFLFFGATGLAHAFNAFGHQPHRQHFGIGANMTGFLALLGWNVFGEYTMFVAISLAFLVWVLGILTAPTGKAGE
jgi:hypothetical protein